MVLVYTVHTKILQFESREFWVYIQGGCRSDLWVFDISTSTIGIASHDRGTPDFHP
jgi:hypothetical protein